MSEQHKTSVSYCKNCKYYWGTSQSGSSSCKSHGVTYPICAYYLDTGKHRGCPVGYCDKKEVGKKRRIKNIVIGDGK